MTIFDRLPFRRRRAQNPSAKTHRINVALRDGQHHEFELGPGDGVGYGPIRIDIHDQRTITITEIEPA